MLDGVFGTSLRLPPHNPQAEQGVLGAIMRNPKALDRVIGFLRPEHFADALHQRIYREQVRRILSGGVADAVALATWYEADPDREQAGAGYLASLLVADIGGVYSVEPYGRVVYETWLRRELIALGESTVEMAFGNDPELPPERQVAEIERTLLDLTSRGATERQAVTLDDAIADALRLADEAGRRGGPAGISTGMRSVDAALGGLEPGTLSILAGRPGMGKTSLALQWSLAAARAAHGVLIFSLEMTATELGRRAVAAAAGVSVVDLKRGRHGRAAERLVLAQKELLGLPLLIEETAGLTPAMIALRARAIARKHPIKLIVLDHVHIVRADADDVKHGATWAVGRISNALKKLAKDLGVPVLALAQLNRALEGREDHRPTKSDLRQAGDLEQDADTVSFIYRPECYLGKSPPEKKPGESFEAHTRRADEWHRSRETLRGRAELIIDKNRDGAEGVVPLRFHGETTSFSEITSGGVPPVESEADYGA